VATAEQQQALAAFGQAALGAFSEVESNLDLGGVLTQQLNLLNEAAQEASEAYRIAQARYREGETDLLDVLTIQQRVLTADTNRVSVQRSLLEQRVNLHLALGGSWTD
jgi:outer membrane protein TolC